MTKTLRIYVSFLGVIALFSMLWVFVQVGQDTSINDISIKTTTPKTIQKNIEDKLGLETNRNVKRNVKVYEDKDVLFISWVIDDNLFSDSIIRTVVRDIVVEITPILQTNAITLKPTDTNYSNFKSFYMIGTTEMIDKYGNTLGEKPVIEVEFTLDTLLKVNPKNMKYQLEKVYDISDTYIVHPSIRSSSSPNGW